MRTFRLTLLGFAVGFGVVFAVGIDDQPQLSPENPFGAGVVAQVPQAGTQSDGRLGRKRMGRVESLFHKSKSPPVPVPGGREITLGIVCGCPVDQLPGDGLEAVRLGTRLPGALTGTVGESA